MFQTEHLQEKWSPVLAHPDLPKIEDTYKRAVTTLILENQEKALREDRAFLSEAAPTNSTGTAIDNWDPILISLVRRSMPNLIAYDICGVQPMTGPTGLIFAMRSRFSSQTGKEALADESQQDFSNQNAAGTTGGGDITDTATNPAVLNDSPSAGTYETATGMTTAQGEALGDNSSTNTFAEMAFSIEKHTVTAVTRALKAEYTMELAQDLKAIHGLDAETELANILSTEILAEINREVIRTINSQAKTGATTVNTALNGVFNVQTDADGRWSVEKFKGLIVQIEREANVIAKETRRGKGNFMICSSDVASALNAAGMLDYTPALAANLQVDDTGNTFAGVLNGRMRVYIDPYATADYVNVGYKGTNPYDAGVFYCPYVPLTMVRAVGEDTFQPKIGFKTRYGMQVNPFVTSSPTNDIDNTTKKNNQYYRIFRVDNILGA